METLPTEENWEAVIAFEEILRKTGTNGFVNMFVDPPDSIVEEDLQKKRRELLGLFSWE